MEIKDSVVVVTGGASGIGRALCRRFAKEGARAVVVADVDTSGAESVAKEIDGVAAPTDVALRADVERLVARVHELHGPIDLYCSNAGIPGEAGLGDSDDEWRRVMDVNVMAHVHAARALVPQIEARNTGHILITASAAGLLSMIGAAPYSTSKHAAVGLAEWLSITYGDAGLGVSCLCPMGVRSGMLNEEAGPQFLLQGALDADQAADATIDGLRKEEFLILPHPEVREHFQHKASDYDRWLRGMRRLRAQLEGQGSDDD